MDEKSRQLIEQMLAEEEYFYGRDTLSTLKKNNSHHNSSMKKKKQFKSSASSSSSYNAKGGGTHKSSASLPSHKTKWTEAEDERLIEALEKYGHGNWKPVSDYVGTRNPLQCKNHARHLQQYNKLELQPKRRKIEQSNKVKKEQDKDIQIPEQGPSTYEGLAEDKAVKPLAAPMGLADVDGKNDVLSMDEDEDLDIVQSDQVSDAPLIEQQQQQQEQPIGWMSSTSDPDTNNRSSENSTPFIVSTTAAESAQSSHPSSPTALVIPSDRVSNGDSESREGQPIATTTTTTTTQEEEAVSEEKTTRAISKIAPRETTPSSSPPTSAAAAVIPSDTLQQPPPSGLVFSPYEIAEEEKLHNPEWFRGKATKTPERYLKIRNHMLACWEQCKPRYLTKTSARKGLKDCGDVNAIGRVHDYLENIGVINVDTVSGGPRIMKQRTHTTTTTTTSHEDAMDDFDDAADLVVQYDGPRKRKVRNEYGEWVDPKELEGRVIEHQVIVRTDSKPKRAVRKFQRHQFYGGDEFGRGYDPFTLIPTQNYHEKAPAPFEVEMISDALLVMDFHSHLAHTEIIGLLGGKFIQRGTIHVLQVLSVFPCQSTSTGIQCEMDPASEMRAREVFTEKGLNVVGWYHSHPTFEPHPSIRDIENQTSYQTLFRDEKTGDEPFIGVIVTPYDPNLLSNHSQIQYLHISKEIDKLHSHRVPYACRRTVIQSEHVPQEILDQLQELVQEYKDYEHKVDMLTMYGDQTRLDKLLDSLRVHLYLEPNEEQAFMAKVKDMVEKEFLSFVSDDPTVKLEEEKKAGYRATDTTQMEEPVTNLTTTTTTHHEATAHVG
ncbi:hypothetical protein BDF20DRAFT_895213 [Mycotypha africana]|uniref:uncharacterized protein n=1 Tax=Mycotypha africana TaxID=64632 RepID=UPI00230031E7|nr:uncharacterized protein BDF20DRAFT_895213 [Mycotypha africana]KAI8968245.1 hypothetical protein BDF20DRAFT_895213 [Mycotypha africana]